MKNLKNKKVAVLGLGLEGKDLVTYLLKQKADVTICDQKQENELDLSGLERSKLNFVYGEKYLDNLGDYEIIFRSPGVYRHLPEIVQAEKKGVEISSAIKLFFNLRPAKIIGVTGTKGKGTTSTLIYKILKKTGKDAYLAGNIGKPFLELLPKLKKTSWVVLELSSFQLIDLSMSPHIAVVLNITTDHMDWHKNRREYIEAKKNIVKHQGKNDFTVVNFDYKDSKSFERFTKAKVYFFSKKRKIEGCYVDCGNIILDIDREVSKIGGVSKLKLRGEHNWENVTAAVCASYLAGANTTSIKETVFSFSGLEHRLELVGEKKLTEFYNDSFSTNPQTTIAAIKSLDEPITLILGGSDKGLDYSELGKEIAKRKNVKQIILIGEIGGEIGKYIKKAKFKGEVLNLGKTSMANIVKIAFERTKKGGVVLLSPATASFDMFENYKDRGDQFKGSVRRLL